jgi:hypothetical protein
VVFTQAQAPHWEGAGFRSACYVGYATSSGVQILCRFCANREAGMTPFAPRSAHSTRHSRAVFCCLRKSLRIFATSLLGEWPRLPSTARIERKQVHLVYLVRLVCLVGQIGSPTRKTR